MWNDLDGGEQAIACKMRLTIQVMIVIPHMNHQKILAFVFTEIKSRQKKDNIASLTVHRAVQIRYRTANWYFRYWLNSVGDSGLESTEPLASLKASYINGAMQVIAMLSTTWSIVAKPIKISLVYRRLLWECCSHVRRMAKKTASAAKIQMIAYKP